MVCGSIGEVDVAFEWLDEALRVRDPALVQIRIAPMFDPLRSDARFDQILASVGLKDGD